MIRMGRPEGLVQRDVQAELTTWVVQGTPQSWCSVLGAEQVGWI